MTIAKNKSHSKPISVYRIPETVSKSFALSPLFHYLEDPTLKYLLSSMFTVQDVDRCVGDLCTQTKSSLREEKHKL